MGVSWWINVYENSLRKAPDKATVIEIEFKKGDPIALNGKLSPSSLLKVKFDCGLNAIGRIDIVENRFIEWNLEVSMKHPVVQFYI